MKEYESVIQEGLIFEIDSLEQCHPIAFFAGVENKDIRNIVIPSVLTINGKDYAVQIKTDEEKLWSKYSNNIHYNMDDDIMDDEEEEQYYEKYYKNKKEGYEKFFDDHRMSYTITLGDCKQLRSLTIPDGITIIGENFCKECISLKEVNLPDSLVKIESGAFQGCSSLELNSLPANVKTVESYAFDGCPIKDNNIFSHITKIGYMAFANTAFKNLEIPSNVEIIEDKAFDGCELDSLKVLGGVERE